MEITEVRIKLMDDSSERLKAFCSITIDDSFVVRDLKIIEGSGGPFVAMPSRKLTSHCPRCGMKNHLRAAHCNQCGSKLDPERADRDEEGRAKLYADIAHPINSECRELIQQRVIEAFEGELQNSRQPGYVSRYEDFDFEEEVDDYREPSRGESRRETRADSGHAPAKAPRTAPAPEERRRRTESASESPRGPHRRPEKPAETKPAETKPAETKPAEKKSAESAHPEPRPSETPGRYPPSDDFGAGIFD